MIFYCNWDNAKRFLYFDYLPFSFIGFIQLCLHNCSCLFFIEHKYNLSSSAFWSFTRWQNIVLSTIQQTNTLHFFLSQLHDRGIGHKVVGRNFVAAILSVRLPEIALRNLLAWGWSDLSCVTFRTWHAL